MFKSIKTKLGLALGAVTAFSASAMAAPVTVDLADAETSLTNVGTAMIAIAVAMLGFTIVYGYIKRRA